MSFEHRNTNTEAWPTDMYYENQNKADPLRDQIENNASAQERLSKLLDIHDSPIRRKVGIDALYPGKVLKTPPKTGAELFRETIVDENLSTYGPISQTVAQSFNQTGAPSGNTVSAEALKTLPRNLYDSSNNGSHLYMRPRDTTLSGNTDIRAAMSTAIDVYNSSVPPSGSPLKNIQSDNLMKASMFDGTQMLSEVKHKLDLIKKSKQQIEARLHYYEAKNAIQNQ